MSAEPQVFLRVGILPSRCWLNHVLNHLLVHAIDHMLIASATLVGADIRMAAHISAAKSSSLRLMIALPGHIFSGFRLVGKLPLALSCHIPVLACPVNA